jgi:hypothetical protein
VPTGFLLLTDSRAIVTAPVSTVLKITPLIAAACFTENDPAEPDAKRCLEEIPYGDHRKASLQQSQFETDHLLWPM